MYVVIRLFAAVIAGCLVASTSTVSGQQTEKETDATPSLAQLLGLPDDAVAPSNSKDAAVPGFVSHAQAYSTRREFFSVFRRPRIPMADAEAIPVANALGEYRFPAVRLLRHKGDANGMVVREFNTDERGAANVEMVFRGSYYGIETGEEIRLEYNTGRVRVRIDGRWREVAPVSDSSSRANFIYRFGF